LGLVGIFIVAKLLPLGMPHLPQCGFKWLTGLPCPLCGGIHAAHSLSGGHWFEALGINPLVTLLVLMIIALGLEAVFGRRWLWGLVQNHSQQRLRYWGIVLLVVVNWMYLLLTTDGQSLPSVAGIGRSQPDPGGAMVERELERGVGLKRTAEWLECQTVLGLGGGTGADRPPFEAMIAAIENVKGPKWADFRDQYGDTERDMALYLGRRLCWLKMTELTGVVGLRNYGVVATNAKRYERRLARGRTEQARMKQVLQLLNCDM
jgi:hypothetical protein